MSANASRMFRERSPRIVRWTDGGSSDWNVGSSARTASVTSIVFDPGCRITCEVDRASRTRLGVQPRRVLVVLDVVEHRRDLLQTNGRAIAVRDDDRLERVGVHQLTGGLDVVGRVGAEQLSRRDVDVPVLQRLIDLVDADALRMKLVRDPAAREPRTSARPEPAPATRRRSSRCAARSAFPRSRRGRTSARRRRSVRGT